MSPDCAVTRTIQASATSGPSPPSLGGHNLSCTCMSYFLPLEPLEPLDLPFPEEYDRPLGAVYVELPWPLL